MSKKLNSAEIALLAVYASALVATISVLPGHATKGDKLGVHRPTFDERWQPATDFPFKQYELHWRKQPYVPAQFYCVQHGRWKCQIV